MGDSYEKEIDFEGKSLIQKAIRRGDTEMTSRAFYHLLESGQFDWLRKRLAVITFEECWPYALNVTYDINEPLILKHCLNLAKAVKNKNAAGLGQLIYAFSKGNKSMLNGSGDDETIIELADDLNSPTSFWIV